MRFSRFYLAITTIFALLFGALEDTADILILAACLPAFSSTLSFTYFISNDKGRSKIFSFTLIL